MLVLLRTNFSVEKFVNPQKTNGRVEPHVERALAAAGKRAAQLDHYAASLSEYSFYRIQEKGSAGLPPAAARRRKTFCFHPRFIGTAVAGCKPALLFLFLESYRRREG
jgi:hypothetical protein